MLDANTTAQLKTYLGNLRRPIELVDHGDRHGTTSSEAAAAASRISR